VAPGMRARFPTRDLRLARVLRAHEHRTAAGLLALLVFAYLWPVLVGGKVLAPQSLVYLFTPWSAVTPEGVPHTTNIQLGDPALLYYPWDVLARRLLHAGVFPAWNPYALAGTTLFGNFQVAWASPFSLPLWILPLNYGLGVAAALKLWLAGFGAYLLARELRLGFWPGIVAAVSFALCAFNIVWLAHGVFVSVAALLPWSLWLVERLVRRGRAVEGLALAGVVALVQTAGHPGTQLHVLAAVVLYALVRAATVTDASRDERLRRLGLVAAALGVGSLLAAVVLLPAEVTSRGTIGVLVRRNGGPTLRGSRVPVHVLRTALFPDWWGRPSEPGSPIGPVNYRERTYYAGSVSLLLALLALASGGAWRRKLPFALLALLGAASALQTPVHAVVVHLPLFDSVQNQRMLLWFVFAVAMLAGFGLQTLLDRPPQRRAWAIAAVALVPAVVAAIGIGPDGATLREAIRHVVDRGATTTAEALALASVAWWALFVASFALALSLLRRRPRAGAVVVALVVAFDLLHFAHGYQSMVPSASAVPPPTPAISFLERHARDGRIVSLAEALPDDFASVYGLYDVRGRDVPQPSLRFMALWRRTGEGEPGRINQISPEGPAILGLLGVRYVVVEPQNAQSVAGLTPVYRGPDAIVYADAFAMPRATVAAHVAPAGEVHAEVAAITRPPFVAPAAAVVRADQLRTVGAPTDGATGTVRVIAERDAQVTLRATLRQRGLVVLDDAWERGWSVRVDGRPARALTADVVLRGVVVPAGAHTVVWSYRVPGLVTGAALSALGLLLGALWAGWLLVRRRSRF